MRTLHGVRRLLVPFLAALAAALAVPSPASAVVGGANAGPYPAMTALYADGSFRCGATLIAPQFVLTAAHCVEGLEPGELEFAVGRQNLRDASSGELIPAEQITVHENYGEPAPDSNDIAVVRLARASTRPPMTLLPPGQQARWSAGRQATVIGWGARLPIVGAGADQLQESRVPMVSDGSCANSYGGSFDAQTMVCAGRLLGDACQGDSGGPLMVPDASGRLAQVGVVSFGFACGLPGSPGVYARVADTPLYGWIAARVPLVAPAGAGGTLAGGAADAAGERHRPSWRSSAPTSSAPTARSTCSRRSPRARRGTRPWSSTPQGGASASTPPWTAGTAASASARASPPRRPAWARAS